MSGQFKQKFEDYIREGYNTIPLIRKVERIIPVPAIFEAFCNENPEAGMLESGRGGRYSYIPLHRLAGIRVKNGLVHTDPPLGTESPSDGDPLDRLKMLMAKWKAPRIAEGPDWQGGALGFLAYDIVRYFESIPTSAEDDMRMPDLLFTVYRDVIALDHEEQAAYLITNVLVDEGESQEEGWSRLLDMEKKYRSISGADMAVPLHQEINQEPLSISPSFSQSEFEQAVRDVQEYIRSGDVFQVNLSVRQDFPIHSKPWEIYKTLRKVNPSPYMGFLQYPDFQIVCGSPELLIKIADRQISTRPIAGTRPRGINREEDLRLARELIENEKERAEHIMLVDLERNDLGRVCEFGTVRVKDLMVIEEYSHVMHIVSHVEGLLAENKDIYDAIRATFPGGTITGAPKIRTMEIIEELEPVRRGIYTGSLGWIGFNGDLEMNIVIRTMVTKEGKGHVQAGAGIVIDSRPDAEYYESLKKAEALLRAAELSEARLKLSRA